MATDNNDIFPEDITKMLEKMDKTIEENSSNLNADVNITVHTNSDNTDINNSFINLNKQIDDTLDSLDRRVDQHKGAFDIWKTFGVELDTESFGSDDANKNRADKDAVYDQLSLLAKVLNKNPKLIGTLTSLNGKNLKLVMGDYYSSSRGEYLNRGEKILYLERGQITEPGSYTNASRTAGFIQKGHNTIVAPKSENKNSLDSSLFHEYAHLIFYKIFDELGIKTTQGETVSQLVNRLKQLNTFASATEIQDNALNKFLTGQINQDKFTDIFEHPEKYQKQPNPKINTLIKLFERINNAPDLLDKSSDKKYVNDANEVFARTFENYMSAMANFYSDKKITPDGSYARSKTRHYTIDIDMAMNDLFQMLNGENISDDDQHLFEKITKRTFKGSNSTEIANHISNILSQENPDLTSITEQFDVLNTILSENNIDITKYKFSPSNINKILKSQALHDKSLLIEDPDTGNLYNPMKDYIYNLIGAKTQEDINKLKKMAELGELIDDIKKKNYPKDAFGNFVFIKKASTILNEVGYDNLSKEEIQLIQKIYNKMRSSEQDEYKNIKTSLDAAMSRIPTSESDNVEEKSENKLKQECCCLNSFADSFKSITDSFKNQFESAIESTANYFKKVFESALISYGDVLARVGGGNNPITGGFFTGNYDSNIYKSENRISPINKNGFKTADGRTLYSQKSIDEYNQAQLRDSGAFVTDISVVPEVLQKSQPLLLTYDPSATFAYTQEKRENDFQDLLKTVTPEPEKHWQPNIYIPTNTATPNLDYLNMLMSYVPDEETRKKLAFGHEQVSNDYSYNYESILGTPESQYKLKRKNLNVKKFKADAKLDKFSIDDGFSSSYVDMVEDNLKYLKEVESSKINPSDTYEDRLLHVLNIGTFDKFAQNLSSGNGIMATLDEIKRVVPEALNPITKGVENTTEEDQAFARSVDRHSKSRRNKHNRHRIQEQYDEKYGDTYDQAMRYITSFDNLVDKLIETNNDDINDIMKPNKGIQELLGVIYKNNFESMPEFQSAYQKYSDYLEGKFIMPSFPSEQEAIETLPEFPKVVNVRDLPDFPPEEVILPDFPPEIDSLPDFPEASLEEAVKESLESFNDLTEENEELTKILKEFGLEFQKFNNTDRTIITAGKPGFDAGGKGKSGDLSTESWITYEKDEKSGEFHFKTAIPDDKKTLKEFMDVNESVVHMQKHLEDYYRFQHNNATNMEVTPLEYLNYKYAERATNLQKRMTDTDSGFASTIYKVGGVEHTYEELMKSDEILRSKLAHFDELANQISHANDVDEKTGQSTNPLTTYKWLRELSELEKDIKKRTANAIKEQQTIYKELSDISKEGEKIAEEGIKQADKMLAGDSTYKSIFGKYKIPELSRSGKFSLTDSEKAITEFYKDQIKTQQELLKDTNLDKAGRETIRNEIKNLNEQLNDYTTGQIADRAKEISGLEDSYKKNVIPMLDKFNKTFGHVFNTNADIDFEAVRQGGIGKLKELSKFINLDKIFNMDNVKKYASELSKNVGTMLNSGVKMFQSAFSKISSIVTSVVKDVTILITGAFATVTAAVTGFVAGFTAMGKSIVSATDVYRKQTIALGGVYQSPTKTNRMINTVYDVTRSMPINYTQAVQTLSEMSAIPALQTILKSNDTQKSDQLLTKMFKVITAMTTMRPDQKSSDAIFSLRNAFAGDLRSLQRRFDLPTANIMNVRGTMGLAAVKTDPMALLDSLENYFDTFLDVSTINKVSDTISVIIEKIKGAIDLFKANIGNSGFYDLVAKDFRKIRNLVLDFVTSDSGKSFAQRLSDVFSNVYNSIKNMAVKIKDIFSQIFDVKFDSLPEMFTSALEFFAKSVKYVDNLLDVKTVVDYVQKLLESVEELKKTVAPMIDTIKKKITEVIKTVLNFSITVLDVIGDVVGALKKTGLNDKGLFYLWLFGPGNVISLIGNGIGAVTSGITASVIGVGLLAKGFSSVAGFIGIASAKLVLIVGSVTALATALYDLISSFDTYSKIFDTIIESLKVEFDQMIVEMGLPGSNAAKTRLLEGSGIAYRGSVDDVIKKDLETYLEKTDSWFNGYDNNARRDMIKNGINDIYYSNGLYRVNMENFKYIDTHNRADDEYTYNTLLDKREELQRFVEYLNGLTDDVNVDMIARQKREKIAEERSKLFGQTKIGKGINAISGAFNGIGSGIDWVKSFFTGDSKGLEGAQTASKTAEQALKDFNKQLESYKNEKGEFDYERFDNDIKAGLVKLTGIKDGIDKIHLDRVTADPESLNYDKQLNSIAKNISDMVYQRGSAFATRIKTDGLDKAFTTSYGNFGAKGIDELNIKRIESFGSIFNVMRSMAKTPEPNVYKSMFTIPIAGINAFNKAMSIDGMIYDTVVKSVDIMRETLAKKSSTYTPTDIVNYIMTKRKAMEDELFSEISDSLMLQYSVYFSTTNEFSEYLNEMQREYKDDLNKMMTDVSEGNINYKNLSDTGKQILTELANRYNAERAYYDNIVSQRMYIEAQNKNIGKMGLGAIKQNWTSLMNSPYKKVRDAAGSRYTDIINEGIENDTIGSMVRKVRDIAINSFTDMKTAVINAVQETVKSTQQTIKNGLDKIIMEGGSFKQAFKELGDTIKKNYVGIYTNEIANSVTKFVYGYSMNAEKENPMAGVENSIAELNVNTSNDIKKFQIENDKNFLMVVTSLDKIREVAERIENKETQKLIHGSVQHQEKMGSMLDALEKQNVTRTSSKVSKNHRYDEYIREASIKEGVPENLIRAVIQQESSFNPNSVSSKGAVGLMQLMPQTAKELGVKNSFDPEDNIKGGVKYLGEQLRRFGRLDLALAAYNAGPNKKSLQKGQIPNIPETQDYVKKVMGYYEKFGGYTEPSSNLESISRTGQTETNDTIISVNKEELNYVKGIFEAVKDGVQSTVSVYAPVINNITSGISGVETITDAFGGFDMTSMLGSSNPISGIAKGISGNKYVQLAAKALPGVGNFVNMLSGKKALTEYGGKSAEKETPLKGIWGDLFGTVENVESKFGGASVGSFLGNMMSGKNIVDSLGAVALKTFKTGTDGAKMIAGSNTLTKGLTGLTSTLFGKSAGQSAAKLLGKSFLGTTVGTALPVIGTVAKVLSGKGWFGGAKDRTAEGRARGAEFNALRDSLVANRNTMARNYYMANDDTVDALRNYQFGGVAMWTSRKGHKWNGTKRRIMNTDATAFTNSMQGYWDLLQKATEEANTNQRKLDKLANTNNLEALRQTGSKESTRLASIAEDLAKYEAAVSRYAGHDTGFTQTLFDGQSYTMTQLNDKVQDLIKELGDSKNAIAQNTEAIRQEKLATADAKLDYETALYGKYNPLISYQNEIQKLNNEWNSVMNDDGTVGYKEDTKEWYQWNTKLLQATENLEDATENLKNTISTDWISSLKMIQLSNGNYDSSQVKTLKGMYTNQTTFNDYRLKSMDKLETAIGDVSKTQKYSDNISDLLWHWGDEKVTGTGMKFNAITNLSNLLNSIGGRLSDVSGGTSVLDTSAYFSNKGTYATLTGTYDKDSWMRYNYDYYNALTKIGEKYGIGVNSGSYLTRYDADKYKYVGSADGKDYWVHQNVLNDRTKINKYWKEFTGMSYDQFEKQYAQNRMDTAYASNVTQSLTGVKENAPTSSYQYLVNTGQSLANTFLQEGNITSTFKVTEKKLIDSLSLVTGKNINELPKIVEKAFAEAQKYMQAEIEHYKANTAFKNTVRGIMEGINNIFDNVDEKISTKISENIDSILLTITESDFFIKENGYQGYDQLNEEVILPLIQSIGNNFNDMASVYANLTDSGYVSKVYNDTMQELQNSLMDKLIDFQEQYRIASMAGASEKELQEIVNNAMKTTKGLKGINELMIELNDEFASAQNLLYQSNAKTTVLGSLSGYDDYEIGNTALKEFNDTLGKNAMNKLLGVQNGMTDFSDETMSKWFGVSGEDPYETYYEYQKKTILQRIKNEKEGSEEWNSAMLDMWNLMKDNADYLKKKAEETKNTIEEMLGKIEETVRTRVAEESKSTKGDFVYIDMGATRKGGEQYARQLLNSIKTDDPEAQKLIKEVAKRMGVK